MPRAKKGEGFSFKVNAGESVDEAVKRLREAMQAEEKEACYKLLKKYGFNTGDVKTLEKQLAYCKQIVDQKHEAEGAKKEENTSNNTTAPSSANTNSYNQH